MTFPASFGDDAAREPIRVRSGERVALAPSRALTPRLAVLHWLLTIGYFTLTFVGLHPFGFTSIAERVDGNPLERTAILSLVAMALPILFARRREAWACLRGNPLLVAVIGLAVLSIVWSDYPGLTLRRSLVLVLSFTISLAIAAGVDDLRRFHSTLFAFVTSVVAVNLLVIMLLPAYTISDIGAKGFYVHKNVAGIIAMFAIIVGVTWTWGARTRGDRWRGLAAVVAAALFLLVTRSKTSLGLAGVMLIGAGLVLVAERTAARLILWVCLLSIVTFLGYVLASDLELFQVMGLLIADPSFTGRDSLWEFAIRTAWERPWLGHGYGAFWDVGDTNDPLRNVEPGTWLGDIAKGFINQAHNGYIELWLNIGLPTTIIGALSVVSSIRRAAWRAVRVASDADSRPALAMFAWVLLIYLLHNMTEATLFVRGSQLCNLAILMQVLAARVPDGGGGVAGDARTVRA